MTGDILALPVGSTVTLDGVVYVVAFRGDPARKFLTYRVKGELRRCAIRDCPGMRCVKGGS